MILDGPAVLLVSDVLVMTPSVDGVILVFRARPAPAGRPAAASRSKGGRTHFRCNLNAAQLHEGVTSASIFAATTITSPISCLTPETAQLPDDQGEKA